MPMLEIRSAKKITDQIGRRPLPIATRGGDGLMAGARGGVTQGPVGELSNGPRWPSRSSSNTHLLSVLDWTPRTLCYLIGFIEYG